MAKNERVYYPKLGGITSVVMANTTNGGGLGLSRATIYTAGDLGGGDGAKVRSINMIVDDANDDGTIETLVPGAAIGGAVVQKWQLVIENTVTGRKTTINYIDVVAGGNIPTDLMAGAQVPMLVDADGNKYFNLENGDKIIMRLQITAGGVATTRNFAAAVNAEEY